MFDIDGTLVDSGGFDGKLYAQAVSDVLGAEIDRSWQSYRHVTDSGILDELLSDTSDEQTKEQVAERVKGRFIAMTEHHLSSNRGAIREIPGARALLSDLLARSDIQIAIATGGWRETAELKLNAIGIDPTGIPIATSSDALSRIEIMKIAEERASCNGPFRRRSYFGDGAWDKTASQELGYQFFAVGYGVEHDIAFPDLNDRGAILRELCA